MRTKQRRRTLRPRPEPAVEEEWAGAGSGRNRSETTLQPLRRRDMATVEKSIQIDLPVRTVYNQWTQFEEFPEFMEGVEKVEQIDDTHLHWQAEIAGVTREWDAEIVDQEPDQRISWRSL